MLLCTASQMLLWWDSYTQGKGGDPYKAIAALCEPLADVVGVLPKWDTILIIVLSIALGIVLQIRQRRALGV